MQRRSMHHVDSRDVAGLECLSFANYCWRWRFTTQSQLQKLVWKNESHGCLSWLWNFWTEWKWSEVGNYKENPKYEGEIKNSLPSGKGVLSHLDKIVYDGEWVKGEMQGMGINYYGNGGKYFGEIKNGILHGIGTFY